MYVSVCVCVEDGTVMVWKPSAWPSLGPSPPACSRFCLVSPVSPSVDPSFFHFLCLFPFCHLRVFATALYISTSPAWWLCHSIPFAFSRPFLLPACVFNFISFPVSAISPQSANRWPKSKSKFGVVSVAACRWPPSSSPSTLS